MEWYMWLLLAPAPVLFFWCCCGNPYCESRLYDILAGSEPSEDRWEVISGTWEIESATPRKLKCISPGIIVSKEWEVVSRGHVAVTYTTAPSVTIRIIFAWTDASNYSFFEHTTGNLKRVGFVVAGSEDYGFGTPTEASFGGADAVKVCWSDTSIWLDGTHFKNVRGVAAGKVGFQALSANMRFSAPILFTEANDTDQYEGVTHLNAECPCCATCDTACSEGGILPETIELTIPTGVFTQNSTLCDMCDDLAGTYVLTKVGHGDRLDSDRWDCRAVREDPCLYYIDLSDFSCDAVLSGETLATAGKVGILAQFYTNKTVNGFTFGYCEEVVDGVPQSRSGNYMRVWVIASADDCVAHSTLGQLWPNTGATFLGSVDNNCTGTHTLTYYLNDVANDNITNCTPPSNCVSHFTNYRSLCTLDSFGDVEVTL